MRLPHDLLLEMCPKACFKQSCDGSSKDPYKLLGFPMHPWEPREYPNPIACDKPHETTRAASHKSPCQVAGKYCMHTNARPVGLARDRLTNLAHTGLRLVHLSLELETSIYASLSARIVFHIYIRNVRLGSFDNASLLLYLRKHFSASFL